MQGRRPFDHFRDSLEHVKINCVKHCWIGKEGNSGSAAAAPGAMRGGSESGMGVSLIQGSLQG